MAERLVEEVQYKISVVGQPAASKAIKTLKADQEELNNTFDELSRVAPTSIQRLRDRFGTLGSEVNKEIGFVRQLNRELGQLDGKKVTTTVDTQVTGGPSAAGAAARGALGNIGTQIKSLPSINISGNFSTDAIGKILQVVDTGLLALGPAAVVAGGAAGAFAFGLSEVTRRTEEATNAAKLFKDQIGNVFDIVASGGGTEEISQRLKQAQDEERSLQQQIDFNKGLFEEASIAARARLPGVDETSVFGALQFSNAANEEIQRITGGAVLDMSSLSAVIEQLEQEAKTATTTVGTYTLQLGSFEVRLNDVRIAEEQANAEIVQSAVNRANAEIAAARFAETATVKSTQQRIEAAEYEMSRLFALNAELAQLGTETANAQIEANNVRIEEQQLIVATTQAITGSVAAREAEVNATKRVFGLIDDVVGSVRQSIESFGSNLGNDIEAMQKLIAAGQKLQEAELNLAAARDKIASDLQEREQSIIADLQEDAAELGAAFGVSAKRAAEDVKRELLKLNRTYLSAVGDRDALQAYEIQLQKQDAKTEADVEAQRREEDYEIRLAQQAAAAAKELDAARAAAAKQLAVEVAKANETIRIRQLELDAARLAYNAQLQLVNQRLELEQAGHAASLTQVQMFVDSAVAEYQRLRTLAQSTGGTGGYGGAQVPIAAASGGIVPGNYPIRVNDGGGMESAYTRNRLMAFSNPTRIFSAEETAAMMGRGGASISIGLNVNGVSVDDVENVSADVALTKITEVFTTWGAK